MTNVKNVVKSLNPSTTCFGFVIKQMEVWANTKLVFPFQIGQTWGFVDVVWLIVRCDSVSPNLLENVAAICWGI